jgi:hypothetical protein
MPEFSQFHLRGICAAHLKVLAKKERIYFTTMEKRGRHRHRDHNRYRESCIIGLLCIDAGSAMMPASIPIAIAIAIPIVPLPGVLA